MPNATKIALKKNISTAYQIGRFFYFFLGNGLSPWYALFTATEKFIDFSCLINSA